ncbi:MAG TPA: glycosyltransferase [Gemmatimonadaceae bacterium]|nr:glycosyltransferase [Gemmatimonadaceae bacterium]
MKRIALLNETSGPGGAEHMVLMLGEELARRGYEVTPVLPSYLDPWLVNEFKSRGFDPETFDAPSFVDPGYLSHLVRILKRRGADVVHSHEFLTSVYGGAAAAIARKPHVMTMHGGRYYAGKRYRREALRWSARRSRAVVGVSAATANELASHLRLSPERVRVVHNGIRPRLGDPLAVRRELGVTDGEMLVVAIGNLKPVKAHTVLLEALVLLNARGTAPSWRLAIAGTGSEQGRLESLAEQHGVRDRLHLLGYRADVGNILAAADVWAMSSLSEGLPLALIEAMFAGRPVVASNVGGMPEVITNDVNGLLVPPSDAVALADALARLFADPALRERLAAAGKRDAEAQFGIDRMVDAYERLYSGAGIEAR